MHRTVGEAYVERVAVDRRIDGDCFDVELTAGSDDPNGDFAAVGDQDAAEDLAPSRLDLDTFCTSHARLCGLG